MVPAGKESMAIEASTTLSSRERLDMWRNDQDRMWAQVEQIADLYADDMDDTYYPGGN